MDRHEELPRVGSHVLKKSKFTKEQMAYALKQAELGISIKEFGIRVP